MSTTRLLLVRHGQSTWNAVGKWQGQADPPLSDKGRRQALAAAASVGMVDAIVASTLSRAYETAEIIAETIGIGPVIADHRLQETDAGEWTGLTRAEIDEGWPGWVDSGRRPDRFESVDHVVSRAVAAVVDIHEAFPGGTVLVVTHGGIMRYIRHSLGASVDDVFNLSGHWYDVLGSKLTAGDHIELIDTSMRTAVGPAQL